MTIRLSVCIPTYNRGAYIGETLESIISQAGDGVEIVVSDNASTDDTEQIVRGYQQRFPRITYFRWDENAGADRNYLKVAELASGDYCWFLGSDDRIASGGVNSVKRALEKNPGLWGMSVGVSGWSLDFTQQVPLPRFLPDGEHIYTTSKDIIRNLGCYFAYLSGLIVRRTDWTRAKEKLERDGTLYRYLAYAHDQVVLEMLMGSPRWLSIGRPLVCYRAFNDSFSDKGVFNRFKLDVVGHSLLIRDYCGGDSVEYRDCAALTCKTWHWARLIESKLCGFSVRQYLDAFKVSLPFYWKIPRYWFLVLVALLPRSVFVLKKRLFPKMILKRKANGYQV